MVYVDDREYPWGGVTLSLMVADSLGELRFVAGRAGVSQFYEWVAPIPMYALAQARRAEILRMRLARRCTAEQLDAMVCRQLLTGSLGEPGDAILWAARIYRGKRVRHEAP